MHASSQFERFRFLLAGVVAYSNDVDLFVLSSCFPLIRFFCLFHGGVEKVARSDVNTVVVTNDLMRDHRNFFPGTREFVRWQRSSLVSFSFAWQNEG